MATKYAGFHYDAETEELTGFKGKRDLNNANKALPEDTTLLAITGPEDLEALTSTQVHALYAKVSGEEKKFKSKAAVIEATFPILSAGATPATPEQSLPAPKSRAKGPGGGGGRGRATKIAGMIITKNQQDNPRRANTHGGNAWNLIVDGMTVEEYQKAIADEGVPGGLKHLQHDLKLGRLTVTAP